MCTTKTAFLLLVIVAAATVTKGQFAQTNLFTGVNLAVPDGDVAGVQEVRTAVSEITQIKSVRVRLKVTGEFNGDLYGYVRHNSGATTHISVLINRTGRASTNHYGYANSGFDVTFDDSATNDIHTYRNITNPPPGVPVSGTWQPDARFVDPASVTTDFPRSAFLSAFNGLSANGEWTLFLADVDEGATNYINSWGLEFTGKVTPSILWTNPAAISYGTALGGGQLNATANTAGTFTYNPPAGSALTASNNHPLTVTFTPDDTNSYVTTSATVALEVLPRVLTITADSTNKIYGHPLTFAGTEFTIVGLVNGDTVNSVTLASVGTDTNATAGNFDIVPSAATGVGLENYSIQYAAGNLNVEPAPLLVQANDASRAYGQPNPLFTATFTGLANGENAAALSGNLVLNTVADTNSPTGTYAIEPSGLSATNYALTYSNGTLTVTAYALILNVDSVSRPYGSTNPPLSGLLTGIQNGENITATFAVTADTNSPVGVYPITPALDDPDDRLVNYTVITNGGNLTVEPVPLLVRADDAGRLYGQTNPLFTAIFTGFVNGEGTNVLAGELMVASSADTGSHVGGYPIAPGGLSATNYSLIFSNGTLTVMPAALTLTMDSAFRVYGQPNPPLSGTLEGIQNFDPITVTFTTAAETNSPVGGYPILPSLQDPADRLGNYSVITNGGSLTIEPAPLLVQADDAGRIYGQTNPPFTATFTGFVNGEDASALTGDLILATPADTNSPVGLYDIEPSGLSATNYTLSYSNGTLTVSAYALTLNVASVFRAYGATNPPLSGTLTGVQNNDNITATFAVTADTNSPVGNYPITPSLDDPNGRLTNYSVITNSGSLTIAPAPLLVRADDVSRRYSQTNPVFSASFTGFVNGEENNVLAGELTLFTVADTNSPVGIYAIEPGGLSATNYALTFSNGSLTVTAFELTLDVNSVSRVYGAPNPPLTGTLSGLQNGDDITTTFQTAADTNSSVGVYPITPEFQDPGGKLANYTVLTNHGLLTITKAFTAFTFSSPTNPVLLGAPCSFTIALIAVAPASGIPSGTVQFQIDGEDYGTPVPLAGGVASLTTTDLPAGQHAVSISYSGDDNFIERGAELAATQVINTPPVATPDIIYRAPDHGTRTPVSSLLANDSDADGDNVEFESVNPMSAVGGTLAETNGWVNYTPPAGFTNDDSFAYAISDGRGGSATGVVTIAVLADRAAAAALTILNLGNDSYRIISTGIPWGSYTIEMSENLPDETWGTLAVGSADTLGVFTIDDTAQPGTSARFYRSVYEGDEAISAPFSLGLASSTNPAPPGSSVTFTLNLTPLTWGSNTASGMVQFIVDDSAYGEPVVMANGSASLVTDTLSSGKHSISAEFSGNQNFRSATCVLGQPQVINTPPVAVGDVVQRNPFQGTKFRLSDLLTNDTDADGDVLTPDRINLATTEGGTLNLAEGWLFYTPPAGFAGADSFRYTVRDSLGGSATATVEITPRVGNDPSANLTLVDLGSGTYRIVFSGIPWRTYTIQYTESLTQPDWQSITTRTADSQGRFSYDDTLPQETQSRYYRSLSESAETHASPFRVATWLNFIAQTNGRTMDMWSQRTYPPGWPNVPPVFAWNTNCLVYGLEGFTGISQCNEFEGAPGQVAVTLLSRRHGYVRGHSMGENGIRTNFFPGKRVWFCAADSTVVQMTVAAAYVRLGYMLDNAYDYSILIFTEDVPESITPVSVMSPQDMEIYYSNTPDLPFLFLGSEQGGHCAANIAPFLYPLWKGGDSGSPDMIPSPDNKLIMYLGRGTSGITSQTQADMDALSLFEGLNPANYQLKWYDLSPWGP